MSQVWRDWGSHYEPRFYYGFTMRVFSIYFPLINCILRTPNNHKVKCFCATIPDELPQCNVKVSAAYRH